MPKELSPLAKVNLAVSLMLDGRNHEINITAEPTTLGDLIDESGGNVNYTHFWRWPFSDQRGSREFATFLEVAADLATYNWQFRSSMEKFFTALYQAGIWLAAN